MVLGISVLPSPRSSSFLSSEFSDIFNLDHFNKVLANDIYANSFFTRLTSRPLEDKRIPVNVTPQWIHANHAILDKLNSYYFKNGKWYPLFTSSKALFRCWRTGQSCLVIGTMAMGFKWQ